MGSPLPLDPYSALGVAKDACTTDIRSAYKKLVLKCHPDKIKDESLRSKAQDEFQKVQEAYELLSDESKRARYDQKARLAELKKDVLDKGKGNATASSSSKNAGVKTTVRGGMVYEERIPTDARFFDIDIPLSEEPRTTSRKYDGYERKQATDERKKSRNLDPKVESIRASKERSSRDKSSRSDRAKNRDKERRREAEDKYRRAYASDDDSDSDDGWYGRRTSELRSMYEERRRGRWSPKVEPKRSRDSDYSDGWDSAKLDYLQDHARQYIQRSKGTIPEHRPSGSWPAPHVYYETTEAGYGDTARRSSARPRSSRDSGRPASSGRDRRGSVDVLDPPLRSQGTGRKVPSMPNATSAPAGIKLPTTGLKSSPPPTMRSSTTFHPREKAHPPPPRRSDTMPISSMSARRTDTLPSKPSKLKDRYDSGYSSPGTPEMPQGNSPPKSSKYTIVDEDDDYPRGHRTILIDPTSPYRRQSSTSPARRERPTISVRSSSKPSRSRTAYAYPSEPALSRDQIPSRHETIRPPMPSLRSSPPLRSSSAREGLFGEITPDEKIHRFPEEQIRYSPRIRQEDISFSHNARKGSLDSHLHRDPYARSHEQHRPPVIRKESCAY